MAVQCQVMSFFISHFRSLNDSVGKSTHQTKAELINGLTRRKRKHREPSIKSKKNIKKKTWHVEKKMTKSNKSIAEILALSRWKSNCAPTAASAEI